MRVLCPWRGIHDLCVDRHSARFEPRKKSQYTGPKVIFKTLAEMRHSDIMALQARFCIGHIRWIPLGLGQRLGSTSWEVTAPDAVHQMKK